MPVLRAERGRAAVGRSARRGKTGNSCKKGAANAAQNTGKLGIIVLGDFEHSLFDFDDDPTLKQTECPGKALVAKLGDIRSGTGLSP